MSTLDWQAMHGVLDNFESEFRLLGRASARLENAVSRIDDLNAQLRVQSGRIVYLENRLRRREKAHKQQHRLIHKLIQQVKGLEEELYVSTDGTPPFPDHSRDGNDSEASVDALLHDDPTVNSPFSSPQVPLVNLPHLSERSRPENVTQGSRATAQSADSVDKASLAPSVSPQSVRTTSSDEAAIRRLQEELGMTPLRSLYPALRKSPSTAPIKVKRGDTSPSGTNVAVRHDPPPTTPHANSLNPRGRADILRPIGNDGRAAVGASATSRAPYTDRTDVDRPQLRSARDVSRARGVVPAEIGENDSASTSIDSTGATSYYTTAANEGAQGRVDPPRTRFRPSSSTGYHRPSSPLQPYPIVRPIKRRSSIASTVSLGIPGSYPRTAPSQSQSNLPPPVRAAPLPHTSNLKDEFDSSQETLLASQQPGRLNIQATQAKAIDEHNVKITLTTSQKSTLQTIKEVGGNGGVRFVALAEEMEYDGEQQLLRLSLDVSILLENQLIRRIITGDDDENLLLECTNPLLPFTVA